MHGLVLVHMPLIPLLKLIFVIVLCLVAIHMTRMTFLNNYTTIMNPTTYMTNHLRHGVSNLDIITLLYPVSPYSITKDTYHLIVHS